MPTPYRLAVRRSSLLGPPGFACSRGLAGLLGREAQFYEAEPPACSLAELLIYKAPFAHIT
jgi:hypothetical protein